MPNDPLNIDDPSHPFSGLGAGLAEMRQRRQAYDARQQMMAQVLAASPGGMLGGSAGLVPLSAAGWGGAAPGYSGQGLAGLGQSIKGWEYIDSKKFGGGYEPTTGGLTTGALGFGGAGMKAPEALPASSVPLGGMAKG